MIESMICGEEADGRIRNTPDFDLPPTKDLLAQGDTITATAQGAFTRATAPVAARLSQPHTRAFTVGHRRDELPVFRVRLVLDLLGCRACVLNGATRKHKTETEKGVTPCFRCQRVHAKDSRTKECLVRRETQADTLESFA